jgi:alpha-D-ribose 1-methylphosphonate 5-triphosphate synthase subunit PhnG
VVKKKPSFAELLYKFQQMAEQKQKKSVRRAKVEFFITVDGEFPST